MFRASPNVCGTTDTDLRSRCHGRRPAADGRADGLVSRRGRRCPSAFHHGSDRGGDASRFPPRAGPSCCGSRCARCASARPGRGRVVRRSSLIRGIRRCRRRLRPCLAAPPPGSRPGLTREARWTPSHPPPEPTAPAPPQAPIPALAPAPAPPRVPTSPLFPMSRLFPASPARPARPVVRLPRPARSAHRFPAGASSGPPPVPRRQARPSPASRPPCPPLRPSPHPRRRPRPPGACRCPSPPPPTAPRPSPPAASNGRRGAERPVVRTRRQGRGGRRR